MDPRPEPIGPEPVGMELVMPFVVCRSKGGPYDDDAFAAGWQAGQIDQALATAVTTATVAVRYPIVREGLVPQLDLVAMRHGFRGAVEHTADGWASITFELVDAAPEGEVRQ